MNIIFYNCIKYTLFSGYFIFHIYIYIYYIKINIINILKIILYINIKSLLDLSNSKETI